MTDARFLFGFAPGGPYRYVAAFALSTVGLFYVNKGRQEQDVNTMVSGALLVLASLVILAV